MAYGEYAKAQTLAEQALNQARKQEISDAELAMCLIDIGTLYSWQDRLDEAEEMCRLGLELQRKVLFDKHPYIAYTLRTLSTIYRRQAKYEQARVALDDAIGIMLYTHKPEDRALAPFEVDIGRLLVAQGKLTEAEGYYKKAISTIKTTYGLEHLYTANVLADMAGLYELQGKYAEAEELINEALTIQEKIYGTEHRLLIPSWLTKAKISKAMGDNEKTEMLIHKALAVVEKTNNLSYIAKLREDVARIRSDKQLASAPVAKLVN